MREAQRRLLREAAVPLVKTGRTKAAEGAVCVELALKRNGVVYFEVNESRVVSDRGYDYKKAVSETLRNQQR